MVLHYEETGNGFPLVIIHGLYGSGENWLSIARRFEHHNKVILPDLRNHGESFHKPSNTYEEMADDVSELLEHLNIQKFNLLGHSMGGKVAMLYAMKFPDKVSKLVIVDVAPKSYINLQGGIGIENDHERIIKGMLDLDLSEYKNRSEVSAALTEAVPSERTRNFLLKNLRRKPEGGFEWKINLPVLSEYLKEVMDNIPVETYSSNQKIKEIPTLFIRGSRSSYVMDSDMPVIKKLFANGQLVTIENAGHWVHAEKPEEFIHTVLQFLA